MKLLRKILFPFVPFYYIVVFLKNKFYDWSFLNSSFYDFPLICVGNLSVGGTGKSPMVEYLVSFLKNKYQLATLSRGYGRDSKGFIIADFKANSKIIGDEPLQLFNKFKDIIVAVDSDRQNGLTLLKKIKPSIEVVLLDDAFQHRNVSAGLNILLTAYDQLYCYDYVLPTGNLREPKSGAKRAHAIVVTKSPKSLSEDSKSSIVEQLNTLPNQEVFFSSIQYADEIKSLTSTMSINELLVEWSYRTKKGYPDLGNPSDILILEEILNELNLKGKKIGIEYEAYGMTGRNALRLNKSLEGYCEAEDQSEVRLTSQRAEPLVGGYRP